MSNLIPPLLSSTPPPIADEPLDEDDDEFGDFRAATDHFGYGDSSLPPSPQTSSPEKEAPPSDFKTNIDQNQNNKQQNCSDNPADSPDKDFKDRRKTDEKCDCQIKPNNILEQKHYSAGVSPTCEEDVIATNGSPESDTTSSPIVNNEHSATNNSNSSHSSPSSCQDEFSKNDSLKDDFLSKEELVVSCTTTDSDNGSYDIQIVPNTDENSENCAETEQHDQNILHKDSHNTEITHSDSSDKYSPFVDSLTDLGEIGPELSQFDTEHSENLSTDGSAMVAQPDEIERQVSSTKCDTTLKRSDFVPTPEKERSLSDEISQSHKENSLETPPNCDEDFQDFETSDFQSCEEQLDFGKFDHRQSPQRLESDDDFGDFETHFRATKISFELPKTAVPTTTIHIPELRLDDDDFGLKPVVPTGNADDAIQCQVSDAGFGPTTSALPPTENLPVAGEDWDDDFGDFKTPDFSATTAVGDTAEESNENLDDDDDDDFDDFTAAPLPPVTLNIGMKDVFGTSEKIVKDIFMAIGSDERIEDFDSSVDCKTGEIFDALKDMTETNALTYQWSKSESQKSLLKALNIDLRNILYGPAWNSTMPRFAANLGAAPLEPVKSDIQIKSHNNSVSSQIKSTTSNSVSSSSPNGVDIPSAQFDWSGAGLVNPLNSTESGETSKEPSQPQDKTDLLFLSSLSERPTPTPSPSLDQTLTYFDTASSSGMRTAGPPVIKPLTKNDLEVFADLNQDVGDMLPVTVYPLRETHISANKTTTSFDIDSSNLTVLPTQQKDADTAARDEDDEDDFDDFQMVLPDDRGDEIKNQFGLALTDSNAAAATIPNHFDIFTRDESAETQKIEPSAQLGFSREISPPEAEPCIDEEFADFQSPMPPPVTNASNMGSVQPSVGEKFNSMSLNPIPISSIPLEPLKPAVTPMIKQPTQIKWPEPGVTDEDIRRIEMLYSTTTPSVESKKIEAPIEQPIKSQQNSVRTPENTAKVVDSKPSPTRNLKNSEVGEDDEWSDFVSVKRTRTPDLALSVFNLNQVQPAKAPIPVVTPSGLIQTKLSSNSRNQPKTSNVVQTSVNHMQQQQHYYYHQPSIISNQFSATATNHVYGNGGHFVNTPETSKSQNSSPSHQASGRNNSSMDEDEWTDFVSAAAAAPGQPTPLQPPNPNVPNFFHQPTKSSVNLPRPPPQNLASSWSTNIIMNPSSHFDTMRGYVTSAGPSYQENRSVNNVQQFSSSRMNTNQSTTIPSISSMPDLDFVAPSSRHHQNHHHHHHHHYHHNRTNSRK